MHPGFNLPVVHLCNRQELYCVVELFAKIDIERTDGRDALRVNVIQADMGAECQVHEDGKFVCRVDAADVERRIGFGISRALGLGKHVGERAFFIRHLRQDVIRCPVDDAVDRKDAVPRQRFSQRLDHRNAPADAAFKTDADRCPPGRFVNLGPVNRQ